MSYGAATRVVRADKISKKRKRVAPIPTDRRKRSDQMNDINSSTVQRDQNSNHDSSVLQQGIKEHPEIALVLEIAARAREIEAKEPPKEIGVSTEVAATPAHSQAIV